VGPNAFDIDDDGVAEALVHPGLVFPDVGSLAVLRLESGTFAATDPIPFAVHPLHHADVNGDGCRDIVGDATDSSGIAVILRACE
jgi:hypothetical protein